MRFFVQVNEAVDGGSVTIHCIDTGSTNRNTNRKALHEYFLEMGVQKNYLKSVMKSMGFVGKGLGT